MREERNSEKEGKTDSSSGGRVTKARGKKKMSPVFKNAKLPDTLSRVDRHGKCQAI